MFLDPELDPRIAAQYDVENVWAEDDDFFLGLVTDRPGCRVLDVGCGTGRLTTAIARGGHAVVGVDPNPSFLALARAKPGGDRVSWIRGTAADVPEASFDVALMTSHVAQVFLDDSAWADVLASIHRALVPGGLLAFDTRDPAARAWESWPAEIHAVLPDGSVLDISTTKTFVDDVARFRGTVTLSDGSGRSLGSTVSRTEWGYRFRSPELVRESLAAAGFAVEAMYGGWHGEPVGDGVGEIVVVATAT